MPPFSEEDLLADPIELFARWFELAGQGAPLPEAVNVATVDADGAPDARMVLLKGFDERGFRFFTNERSEKGRQLTERPRAAMTFYWRELDRQVRVRGAIERVPDDEADEYFASRPRDSQLGAWASPQSEPLRDRADLDERLAAVRERFADGAVERPSHWGGFRLVPDSIEFWQGQVGRLHDRFRYERDGDGWQVSRLGP
jgi:pyridoxamine 5'-phosphate oxidase